MTIKSSTRATLLATLFLAPMGCGDPPKSVSLAQVCDRANHKKTIEVSGYIGPESSVYCSGSGSDIRCKMLLSEQPGAAKGVTAEIKMGSGANTMDRPASRVTRDNLVVRDAAGQRVAWSDKVMVTAEAFAVPNSLKPEETVCLLKVEKITR